MAKMNEKQKNMLTQTVYVIGGSLIYALGFNVLIVPVGLYSGGFMGIAQLLKIFLTGPLHIGVPSGFNLTGMLYFLLNIPLFYMGYRIMGKEFAFKSLITVGIQTVMLMIVPISANLLISDSLTSCIIGGIVAGTGSGLVLRGRASSGGQDIIGLCLSKKFPNFSVGRVSIVMNIFIYGVCLFLFNFEVVVYSLIFATVSSMAIDRVHIQNINMNAMIITKKPGIAEAIMEQMKRGVTDWKGEGAYTHEANHILYVMISKYEREQIKKIVHGIDPDAFMVFTEGSFVEGNFEKRL